ncbi:MAG: tRNA 2-thiouridine(34) synthase MnmA [Thermodesulfovibrionaceae bacterium]
MQKVVVAISGGVDSSVAVYLLKEKGFTVEGIFFCLFDEPPGVEFAKKIAEFFNIKLHIWDLRESFKQMVIEPFFRGYKSGITPNPCVLCNRYIKFPTLKKVADLVNAKFFATGHYARIIREDDSFFLSRGVDRKKDQSYFLYGIDKKLPNQLIFPIGEYLKEEVREIATKAGIPSKIAEESVDVCFLKNKRYYDMIKSSPGPIIEKSTGKIIGQHKGIHLFTIGQRKRLNVSVGYPAYVVEIDPIINAVYIASYNEVYKKEFYVTDLNWFSNPKEIFVCTVKIRYTMEPQPATITLVSENKVKVSYHTPQFAPTPGQSAVFYDGDKVIGGGIILKE